ncbi:MAG: isochorismatase family protein [Pseudomonadota bacterium]
MLLDPDRAVLMLIDLQDSLVPAMHTSERELDNVSRLLTGAETLGVPVVATEQNPDRLGGTVASLDLRKHCTPVPKQDFDASRNADVCAALSGLNRGQVVLAGLEAHVCVLQTAAGLLNYEAEVFVVADAVMSRRPENRTLALRRLSQAGAQIVGTEMVLFEWLGRADTPAFRTLLPVIK